MTLSNIQLLIGVYDSGKKFANFERNIKYTIDNAMLYFTEVLVVVVVVVVVVGVGGGWNLD